jgi:hypothetical protein
VTEAGDATDGYARVLDAGLVSRLDHGAYLGRELARAGARPAQRRPLRARRRTRVTRVGGHPVTRGESYVTLPYRLAGLSPAGA